MDTKTLIALLIFCGLLIGVGVVCYQLGRKNREVVQHEVRVELPGDTVTLPGMVRYISKPVSDQAGVAQWQREAEDSRHAAVQALAQLSIYESMASRVDTTFKRSVDVYRGDSLIASAEYQDPVSVEYFYLPADRFHFSAPRRSFPVKLPVVPVKVQTGRTFWNRFGYGLQVGVGYSGVGSKTGYQAGPGVYAGFGITYDFSKH